MSSGPYILVDVLLQNIERITGTMVDQPLESFRTKFSWATRSPAGRFMRMHELQKCKRIWISWETQRRSVELANILNCQLYIIEFSGFLRYPKSILKTISIISKSDCQIVFVQNPSMLLATVACIYKIFFGKKIVVDRHTTFRLDKPKSYSFNYLIFSLLNKLTLRVADITLVTNKYLAAIVRETKGNPYILPDKLPVLEPTDKIELSSKLNIMFIASFAEDEPIEEVLKALDLIKNSQFTLYVTGNDKKLDSRLKDKAPTNVVFTGFLKEPDFVNLLFAVDAVMVLTTATYCMLCGCYEGVVACKPLITSRKQVLQEYFKGSVFVDNTVQGIAKGLTEMITNFETYKANTIMLKNTIELNWQKKFLKLESILNYNKTSNNE